MDDRTLPLPFIHQPTGFSSFLQASRGEGAKLEPAHTAEAVRPNVRVASFEVLAHGIFDRGGVNAIRQLEPEFQDVVDAFLPDRYLPILANPLHIVEDALEDFRVHVPGAHYHHLVAPTVDFGHAAESGAAGAGFLQEPCHITHAIADQRHGVPGERSQHEFAITLGVGIHNFKKEVVLIHVVAVAPQALHSTSAALLGGSVAEDHGTLPEALDVVPINLRHAVAGSKNQLEREDAFLFGNLAQAHQPCWIGNNDVVLVERHSGIEFPWVRLADRRAENSHALASEERDPATDPIRGVESADYPVARPHPVFPHRRSLVTGRELQLVVSEINALGASGGAGCFKHQLRFPADEIFRRQIAQVLGGGEDAAQIFRAADPARLDTVFPQLAL